MAIEELKDLDPVYSMALTVKVVSKALEDIDPAIQMSKKQERTIELVEEKIAEAEDWYERPLDSPDVYAKLIEIELKRGGEAKAREYERRIKRFHANEAEFLGRQQEFFGNSKAALQHYNKALSLDHEHPLALPGKEKVERRLSKAINSMEKLTARAEKGPDDLKAWHDLGEAALHAGDVKGAIECLDKALALEPDDVKALCKRGSALASQGLFEEALPFYERALELNPSSTTAKRGKNYMLYNLGRLD